VVGRELLALCPHGEDHLGVMGGEGEEKKEEYSNNDAIMMSMMILQDLSRLRMIQVMRAKGMIMALKMLSGIGCSLRATTWELAYEIDETTMLMMNMGRRFITIEINSGRCT